MTMPLEALVSARENTMFSDVVLQYHWERFLHYAESEGIDVTHADDYIIWWNAYLYGATQECERK